MTIQTRDQQYAASAFNHVEPLLKEWVEKNDICRKQYGSMAFKLPVLIRTAGLAQALAFVQARSKKPAKKLLDHVAATLEQGSADNLAKVSREADLAKYMQLTQQVLAASVWYKRFAQSLLGYEPGNDDDSQGDLP